MTGSARAALVRDLEDKLPSYDWVLLPMLAVATVAVMACSFSWVSGRMFRSSRTSVNSCLIQTDRLTGGRAIPNTVCYQKDPETELTEYKFNNYGHRAAMPFGPKAPGSYRIVMLGSSMDFGFSVAQEKTFAALLPGELSRRTGRKIEVYNEAMLGEFPRIAARRVKDALAGQPNLILWVLAPRDIRNASTELISDLNPGAKAPVPSTAQTGGLLSRGLYRFRTSLSSNGVPGAAASLWQHGTAALKASPSGMLLQHLLYASQTQYIKSFLLSPDSEDNGPDVGFLRTTTNARWRKNLDWFNRDVAELEEQANAGSVPVVVMLIPDRVQSAMISSGDWPNDFDPYKLNGEVSKIVTEHGGIYIDALSEFKKLSNPERHFFLIDGHPDTEGHRILSRIIADKLVSGSVPALSRQSVAQETTR